MSPRAGRPHRHQWTPEEMDRLERAIVEGSRVQLLRRGTEYVVVPREIVSHGAGEALLALTYTGGELEFALDEVESFEVL